MKKHKKQKNKGITLIALVITVIVLLILAGVTITALSGSNGILSNAVEAKKQTVIADVKEQAKVDILSEQANKKGEALKDTEVEKILEKYGEITGEETELKDKVLKTENGGYDIPVLDIIGDMEIISQLGPGKVSQETVKDNYEDENGDKATIPEGFRVSEKSE